MRVLYIVPYAPFGEGVGPQGPKNFSANILRFLSKEISLDLIVVCDDNIEPIKERIREHIPDAGNIDVFASEKGYKRKFSSLVWGLKGYPLTLGSNFNKSVRCKLLDDVAEYDLVHFDYYNTVVYRKYLPPSFPCIITPHDAYSLLYKRAAENCERLGCYLGRVIRMRLFLRMELNLFKRFNRVLTVSPVDCDYMTHNGLSNVRSIPIPIQDKYLYHKNDYMPMNECKTGRQAVKLLVSVPLTVDWCIRDAWLFVENGLEIIQRRYPGLEIVFWGKGAEKLKTSLKQYKDVDVIDYVSDYERFLNQNWIFVYTRKVGAGLHTKVQEMMAFGLPVVGYSNIMNAFNGVNGVHDYSVETNDELIEKICRLLGSRGERYKLSQNAKMFAAQQYNLESVGQTLLENYSEIIKKNTLSH